MWNIEALNFLHSVHHDGDAVMFVKHIKCIDCKLIFILTCFLITNFKKNYIELIVTKLGYYCHFSRCFKVYYI